MMKPISRREFLTRGVRTGAGVALGGTVLPAIVSLGSDEDAGRVVRALACACARGAARSGEVRITILHTNDTHSRLEPFPPEDKEYGGLGGAARRAALVKRIRKQNPNTLLVDAGDAFQGTPFYNFYHGEAEYRVMSEIGYDVVTLGNHEFDSGVEALARAVNFAKFDIVVSNYDFRDTWLRDRVKPYVTRELGGIKVGLFGLGIAFDGLVLESNRMGVRYYDPVQTARAMVRTLKDREGAVLVICLSHLGLYERKEGQSRQRPEFGDRELAEQVEGIDAIIGGHTHTFMHEPELIRRPSGSATVIFQVGFGGINLGRLDFILKEEQIVGLTASVTRISEDVV